MFWRGKINQRKIINKSRFLPNEIRVHYYRLTANDMAQQSHRESQKNAPLYWTSLEVTDLRAPNQMGEVEDLIHIGHLSTRKHSTWRLSRKKTQSYNSTRGTQTWRDPTEQSEKDRQTGKTQFNFQWKKKGQKLIEECFLCGKRPW